MRRENVLVCVCVTLHCKSCLNVPSYLLAYQKCDLINVVALTLQKRPLHFFTYFSRTHRVPSHQVQTNKFAPIINFFVSTCEEFGFSTLPLLLLTAVCVCVLFPIASPVYLHDNISSNLHIFLELSEIICRSVLHMWHDLDITSCIQMLKMSLFVFVLSVRRDFSVRIGIWWVVVFSVCAQVSACTNFSSSELCVFFLVLSPGSYSHSYPAAIW